jgi:hypothetical protein
MSEADDENVDDDQGEAVSAPPASVRLGVQIALVVLSALFAVAAMVWAVLSIG